MDENKPKSRLVAQYALPYEGRVAGPVYMIVPGYQFYKAWRETAPDQADPAYIAKNAAYIEQIKRTLSTDPSYKQALPHIGIDVVRGKPEVSFVEGRKRFTALKELGEEAIPALVDTVTPNLDKLLPFVKPVPPELLAKLHGDDDPDSLARKLAELDKNPEVIADKIRWAKSAEGAASLRKWFVERGLGAIAEDCVTYYQEHGTPPPAHEIDKMNQKATVKAQEMLRQKGHEAITEQYMAQYQRTGKPPAEEEMERMAQEARHGRMRATFRRTREPDRRRGGRGDGGLSM